MLITEKMYNIITENLVIEDEDIIKFKRFATENGIDLLMSIFADIYANHNEIQFKPHHLKNYFITLEFTSTDCQSIKQIDLTFVDFYFYILDLHNIVCTNCVTNRGKAAELENTYFYIERFLNPKISWLNNYPTDFKIRELQKENVNYDAIKTYICSMKYSDFLLTPYWKAITHKKMKDAGFRCQLCKKKGLLNTHHRTYSIHGYELQNLNELIVLCKDCHESHHFKEKN